MKSNGTLVAWGKFANTATFLDAFVPADLTNVSSIAGSLQNAIATRNNGAIKAWGFTNAAAVVKAPTNITTARAVGTGWNHGAVALQGRSVIVWGVTNAELGWHLTDVPTNLNDAVAISAGAFHTLALRGDGTVVSWGANSYGETNVPAGLSNVVTAIPQD